MAKSPSTIETPKSVVPAIPTLNKGVSWGRVVGLLGLLAWRFEALVTDPVGTLTRALPVVATLQLVYVVLCIPASGSQATRTAKKPRPGEKKKTTELAGSNAIVTALLALILSAVATPFVHVAFVLFGAPFLDHVSHTFLCAAHFSLLGVFPVLFSRGLDSQALVAVAGASAPLDETFGGLLGAVLGAWLGAVPIPLDWDREWQKWPVTIVCGLYAGACLGSWASGTLLYGKRLGKPSGATKLE